MVTMAAAKLAALLAMAALFAVAGAANPQEAHCWQCYYSCMQQKCGGYRNPAAHTAVDDGAAAASVPVNSTDGIAAVMHPTDGGAAAHVAGGYESYCKCNKACIVDCYKALPPVCYQMCVSETCSKLPPCKQAECYKACGDKCYHKQPSPGPKPPSPKPTPPKPAPPSHGGSPKPTPPKPAPPNHGGSPKPKPPKPAPPNHGGSPKPKPPKPAPPNHGGSPKWPCPPHAPKPKPKPKPCPPKPKPKPPCPCPPAADVSASTNNSNN
ncbi:hypothetical protein VPH35_056557 [Triticum aestivum]|uniref:Uncharacterized protein n=1 Tax=Triticum aestivum TaxID=4565 RepID=A0A080YU73_WHEAT|nr:formin-like protein 3 [Triticum aestivum]CDM86933.1 unnamed protein product [Triticum aestivum]